MDVAAVDYVLEIVTHIFAELQNPQQKAISKFQKVGPKVGLNLPNVEICPK
jgi:hypothetical protein